MRREEKRTRASPSRRPGRTRCLRTTGATTGTARPKPQRVLSSGKPPSRCSRGHGRLPRRPSQQVLCVRVGLAAPWPMRRLVSLSCRDGLDWLFVSRESVELEATGKGWPCDVFFPHASHEHIPPCRSFFVTVGIRRIANLAVFRGGCLGSALMLCVATAEPDLILTVRRLARMSA